MEWLVHSLSSLYMHPQESKVKAVNDFPTPVTSRQALSFISMCSFYQQYIEAFAIYAAPIYKAVKSDPFIWHDAAHAAFQALKIKMSSKPVLRVIDPSLDFTMYCDASGLALAAVLEQHFDPTSTHGHPVAYASRQFSKHEMRLLSSPAKELCSIIYGITLWNSLIAGSKVTVKTDCICWSYLALASASSNRMSRLGMILSEHNIHIEHIPGHKNKASDGLSRAYDATANKVDSYKINKDQRVEFLTAPNTTSKEAMPLADYMHLCRQHIAKTWPPKIPEPITKEINLLHDLSEAMNPPKGPKNEKEFAKLITQPLTYRRRDPLIHIQSEPELNPMSQEKADKLYSTSRKKSADFRFRKVCRN
jgi:hypothetical protein